MVDKAKKYEIVDSIKTDLEAANTVVVAKFDALSISDTDELRQKAKENGAGIRVTKNTLAKIASKQTVHKSIEEYFSGQTIISFSEDPVAAAKIFVDFAKDNDKLKLEGASYEGTFLDVDGLKRLASTPSLDESRGKLVGLLTAAAGELVGITNAPAGQLARVFSAYSESQK